VAGWVVGKSGSQRGMRTFTVVVGNPLRHDPPEMPFVERNYPIETLAPGRPNDTLTMRVRLRCARHRTKGFVHGRREDAIAIMDEEPVGAIQRQAVSKLLDRPFRRGVFREIPVHDLACADVEDDEDI
jgi:hypothetical protein